MDQEVLPLQETVERWLYAHCPTMSPPVTESADMGRWFISRRLAEIDAYWAVIRGACRAGKLGPTVKCTTAHPALLRRYSGNATIRVLTTDWRDEADVWRVEQALRDLGVRNDLKYKTVRVGPIHVGFVPYLSRNASEGGYERLRLMPSGSYERTDLADRSLVEEV